MIPHEEGGGAWADLSDDSDTTQENGVELCQESQIGS